MIQSSLTYPVDVFSRLRKGKHNCFFWFNRLHVLQMMEVHISLDNPWTSSWRFLHIYLFIYCSPCGIDCGSFVRIPMLGCSFIYLPQFVQAFLILSAVFNQQQHSILIGLTLIMIILWPSTAWIICLFCAIDVLLYSVQAWQRKSVKQCAFLCNLIIWHS